MIPFKVNGKKVSIKSSWDDVTYSEYLSIIEAGQDTSKILSILTGIPADNLRKASISGADQLLIAISFANTPIVPLPKLSQLGKYKLPLKKGVFDIQFESLIQFEDLRTIMTSGIKDSVDLLKAYPKAVAIYLQKIRDGEYDHLKAEEMEDEILTLPCREVVTAGSFFLARLLILYSGIKGNYPKAVNRSPRTGKSSQKRSGRTVRSIKCRGR